MMLEWLGSKHQCNAATTASELLTRAVDDTFAPGLLQTCELGGNAGLVDVTEAVNRSLDALEVPPR